MPSATDDHQQLRVAIIGGGLGGLALAIGLQQYTHLDVHVFESKDKLSEVGAGVTLFPNAITALKSISPNMQGPMDHCMTMLTDNPSQVYPPVYAGGGERDGQCLGLLKMKKAAEVVANVHRPTFLAELEAVLDQATVHLNKQVVSVSDEDGSVQVYFKNHESMPFDVAIGADGLRSVVRQSMFRGNAQWEQPEFANCTTHRSLVSMDEAVSVLGKERMAQASFTFGPRQTIVCYPTDMGRKVNMVLMTTGVSHWEHEKWVIPSSRQEVEEALKDWGEAGAKWVQLFDKPGLSKWAIWQSPALPYYSDGSIAIIGDAAHSMSPASGNGAAAAFEDAAVLTAIFQHVHSKEQIPHALCAYDLTRRARAQKLIREARRVQDTMGFHYPGTTYDNCLQRLEGTLEFVVNRDIHAQNQQGVRLFLEATSQCSATATK